MYLNKVVPTTHNLWRVGLRYENLVHFPRLVLHGGLYLISKQRKNKTSKRNTEEFICICAANKVNQTPSALTFSHSFWIFSSAALASEHPPHIIGGIFEYSDPEKRKEMTAKLCSGRSKYIRDGESRDALFWKIPFISRGFISLAYLTKWDMWNIIVIVNQSKILICLNSLVQPKKKANKCSPDRCEVDSSIGWVWACDPWLKITGNKLSHRLFGYSFYICLSCSYAHNKNFKKSLRSSM